MSTTQHIDVGNTIQNLEDSDLSEDNTAAIRDFINHCAAEGLSESRQVRHAQSLKSLLQKFAPDDFQLRGASESSLKQVIAGLNRSDYAEATKRTMRGTVKKFYKVENGGHEHPDKVRFVSLTKKKATRVGREDLFTEDELKRLFRGFSSTRDRAFTMVLYESAGRPGEILNLSIADFTSNEKGDFVYLEGLKQTPDRTNQLVRAGRALREWLVQHPLGGELGSVEDSSASLWVKTEQQACMRCGDIPHNHSDSCSYEPDLGDEVNYDGYLRRFKDACREADISENKRRPYNLRHTRLTEVATFMGYEQLNKFAGWTPGSDRAKVYVHLNNDDVNKAIRDQYGLSSGEDESRTRSCPFCDAENQVQHSECRNCGRPMDLESKTKQNEKREVLERLSELEEQGVLDELERLQK
ncbi:tyrosine-type recombinase/integrase [Haloquadratum walsbyi]|uniref:Integrase family protein n=1 Tax=Haloquadratum walsbyi (strain DSM 16790 / HBSQ001) TaxID=362976 RepID=Q18F90_HALWD|nr:tyrosine-type recombinase/integrase [Haloquadratum walsbyi]CAJ53368.1 integrase family protein [Haloquadratum walsbyi DSM 16790]